MEWFKHYLTLAYTDTRAHTNTQTHTNIQTHARTQKPNLRGHFNTNQIFNETHTTIHTMH